MGLPDTTWGGYYRLTLFEHAVVLPALQTLNVALQFHAAYLQVHAITGRDDGALDL